jgi:predicted TIM-barrel fold metal-dependent hydrolase
MDAAGIDMQVLSLNSPGVEQSDPDDAAAIAHDANDFLSDVIKLHPTRFAGFASVPIQSPDKAAQELERCVRTLGFKGANINGHTRGRYLDDVYFTPVLECAEALNLPIYLHPTEPTKIVMDALYGGFSPAVSGVLATKGWGWHIETAVHVLRLILSGVFDRHPKLQIVIGHLGEGIPFMLPRLNKALPVQMTNLERPLADYLRQNVHYTFGGFNFMPTFLNLLLEVGVDRIIFSADYPYCSMDESRSFLEHLPVSEADRARIAHGNAERLLGL